MKDIKVFIILLLISIIVFLIYFIREQQCIQTILAESHKQLEEWLMEAKKEAK